MLLATKMLRDFMIARHVTPCNLACNLCRSKIEGQVATQVSLILRMNGTISQGGTGRNSACLLTLSKDNFILR